jgi:prolipoprotein diacylglyceryltransferase
MLQVLLHIPIPVLVLMVLGAVALGVFFSLPSRRARAYFLASLTALAVLLVLGVLPPVLTLAGVRSYLSSRFPDGIPVYGFGMMLFLAFLLCTWLASRRAVQVGIAPEVIQDLAIWVFVGGLLGARITYLLSQGPVPDRVSDFLLELVKIWDGGIVLYGSVLGALAAYAVAYWFVFRKQGIRTLKLADVVAPSIAVGVCLGRIGCFLNGCCYGQVACQECAVVCPVHFPLSAPARLAMTAAGYQTAAGFTLDPSHPVVTGVEPTSAAWAAGLRPGDVIEEADGQTIDAPETLAAYLVSTWPRGKTDLTLKIKDKAEPLTFSPHTLGLHPTQLYEVISMGLLTLLLLAFSPLKTRDGQVMALLMICYAAHRYLNELLRSDDRPVGFERYGSVALFLGGVALLLWTWRKRPGTQAVPRPA